MSASDASQPAKVQFIAGAACSTRPKTQLAVVDVNSLFRVLRFLSAHPALAGQVKENAAGPPPTQSPTAVPPTTPTDPKEAAPVRKLSVTGISRAVGNQIRIPASLKEPLEEYRRAAVTVSTDADTLAAARQKVRLALEELCSALDDAAVTQALSDDVFAYTEDDFVESDSTEFAEAERAKFKLSTNKETLADPLGGFGPQTNVSGLRVSNRNEMQQIVPGLWCGPWHPARNKAMLHHYGITHICCCIGTQPAFPTEFMYFSFSAEDSNSYNIMAHFDQTFEFIENALVKSHGNVLVHCGAGISRAPTIVAAYLMRKLRISSTAAVQLIQHHRFLASPNMSFRDQLFQYGKKLEVMELSATERGQSTNAGMKQAASASRQ